VNAALHTLSGIVGDDSSTAGNEVHQPFKGCFDGIEILINVGMIELHGGKDHRVWEVVQKLRTFIEEGGVVLVAFEDEVFPLTQSEAAAEVFRNATDQKRGLVP